MATANVNVLPSATPDENSVKKRSNRGFGGHPRRRVNAAARNRERQGPMEECHLKSRSGFQLPLCDGASQVTFQYYLGEHQSQIFYGGLTIAHPGAAGVHVELGQPIPIDLRENYLEDGPTQLPCLAAPTHIFRRFRVYRITSSASWDLKKLAGASLSTDGASPDDSDASCPPAGEKAPLLVHSMTPKSGLSLISLRVYYPVQYMQSANELHPTIPGSRKRVHLPPQYDEVVAYQNLLTMSVSEFASRVLKGVAGSASLLDCSSELPKAFHLGSVDLNESESKTDPSTDLGCTSQRPSFLVLPVNVYNRFISMKRILLDGYKSPICPSMGWCVATSRLDKEKANDELAAETPGWDQWIGLENVIATPSWIIAKLLNGGVKANTRMVFVRRQSDDCGSVICPLLRKSMFGPARIRRTRVNGADGLVMKVKQLTSTSNPNPWNGAKEEQQAVTSLDVNPSMESIAMATTETLNFRYVWSRDYRSNVVTREALGPLLSTDIEGGRLARSPLPETVTAPPSSSVTNASTDEEDTRSIGERWHQAHQKQRHHRRPTRSCLPPQRLEVVDRDLEKALQRSLADGRNKHTNHVTMETSPPQPPSTAKRRSRQKCSTNSSNPSTEKESIHKLTESSQQHYLQNGMKRTKSEAMLQEFSNMSASKPLASETAMNTGTKWAHRLRSNSPSATSDSAVSNCRRKQVKGPLGNKTDHNVYTTEGNEESSFLPTSYAEHRAVAVASKLALDEGAKEENITMETLIPKLTLAIGENGRVRVKPQCYQMHQSAATVEVELDDPYALPSSPVNSEHKTTPKKKRRSPSPDPPILLPEEEIDHMNSKLNGNVLISEEDLRGNERETTSKLTVIGSTYPRVESELLQSRLASLPLSPSLQSLERSPLSLLDGHRQHSLLPPFSTSVDTCSVEAPVLDISLPSSLLQITNLVNQPVLPLAQLPSTPPSALPSTSLQAPGGSHMKPKSSKHIASFHLNDSLWNGDCSTSRRPATMWTPRNEPLPPPDPPLLTRVQTMGRDDGLCFFHPPFTTIVPAAAVSSAASFQSTLLSGVLPVQQHQAPTAAATTVSATTSSTEAMPIHHQQAFLNATATGYSMLTSDAATALAMAAVAYFNPSIYAATILQPPAPGSPSSSPISNHPPVTATVWNNIGGRFL